MSCRDRGEQIILAQKTPHSGKTYSVYSTMSCHVAAVFASQLLNYILDSHLDDYLGKTAPSSVQSPHGVRLDLFTSVDRAKTR